MKYFIKFNEGVYHPHIQYKIKKEVAVFLYCSTTYIVFFITSNLNCKFFPNASFPYSSRAPKNKIIWKNVSPNN